MTDFGGLPKDVRLLIAKRLSIDARLALGCHRRLKSPQTLRKKLDRMLRCCKGGMSQTFVMLCNHNGELMYHLEHTSDLFFVTCLSSDVLCHWASENSTQWRLVRSVNRSRADTQKFIVSRVRLLRIRR